MFIDLLEQDIVYVIEKKIPDIIALMSHFISCLFILAVIGLCCYEWTFSSYGVQGLLSSGGVHPSLNIDIEINFIFILWADGKPLTT